MQAADVLQTASEARRPAWLPTPSHVDRHIADTYSSLAAAVLAKTQAAAARAETYDIGLRLHAASEELRAKHEQAAVAEAALAEADSQMATLRQEAAVAKARVEELRCQLAVEQDRTIRLAERLSELQSERGELRAALGWSGRRRLRALSS